jgi:hypothetical protein
MIGKMPDREEEMRLANQWQESQKKLKQERKELQAQWREEESRKLLGDRIAAALKRFRLVSCKGCTEIQMVLNHRGPDWSLANIDWVVGEIEANVKSHPQLLVRLAGKLEEKSQTVRDFLKGRLESVIREQKDDDEMFNLMTS